ncbi:MAG: S41 family peptidase [Clostridia bacterium]|nr:S41 family peptidase [Clostridia bacterium]
MKKRILLALSLVLALCLLSSCAYLPFAGLTDMLGMVAPAEVADHGDTVTISKELYEKYEQFDKLIEIQEIADMYFFEEVDNEAMLDGAALGLLSGLDDPYTFYYSPEEYAEYWEDDEGEYAGVGIQISGNYATGLCTISRVFDNGPAKEAGVHKGDILYKVEDLYVDAYSLQDAVDIMRGTPGTDVNVTFLRDGEEMSFVLTRAQITVNRVESTMLAEGIGYIALYEFAGDCAAKFEEALDNVVKQGAKGVIIDLRDNPGGWVDDAETIGDLFLDKGTLCYLEYRDGTREYYSTKDGKTDVKLVILMNEHSASSSEILAGALKDRADATIVGVQSYGKGIVQSVIPISDDGSGMQLTIAQYYTPNGNKVHKIGITPDVEIQLPEGDNGMYEFADLADPQLSRALEVMQEKLAK